MSFKITIFTLAVLLICPLHAKAEVRTYSVTVKHPETYIPYHLYGIEKEISASKSLKDAKIIIRAGTIKFKMHGEKRPTEQEISAIFERYGLKPGSVAIKKLRKKK